MKLSSRDIWLLAAVLAVLLILTVFAVFQQSSGTDLPSLSIRSSSPVGGKALYLWMEELGFEVDDDISGSYSIPPDTNALVILQPIAPYQITEAEWEQIDDWVDQGGVLIIAGSNYVTNLAFQHFGFNLSSMGDQLTTENAYTPLMDSPPMTAPAVVNSGLYLNTDQADYLPLVAVEDGPLAVSFPQGEGTVVLTTLIYSFTNKGLKETGNPALILNVFKPVRPSGKILFDEWHHGFQEAQQITGPSQWLTHTSIGNAVLFDAALIFISLVLSGRQFGVPIPIKREASRRRQMEYIDAVTNLRRRAGHRRYTLLTYYKNLKRAFGWRYRLDPGLEDEEFTRRLSDFNPTLDTDRLLDLLRRLKRPDVSESAFVQLSAEASEWLNQYKRNK